MPTPNETEPEDAFRELLQAARSGDKKAQGRLLEVSRRPLLYFAKRYSRRTLQSKVSPSDVVQEAFLQAVKEINTFEGCTPDDLFAWLRVMVRNNCGVVAKQFDTSKRQVQREVAGRTTLFEAEPNLAVPSAGEEAIRQEEFERLDNAVEWLPDHFKAVVRLRNGENRSFEEIGRTIGRTAEAVRKLWKRALAELNRRLAG